MKLILFPGLVVSKLSSLNFDKAESPVALSLYAFLVKIVNRGARNNFKNFLSLYAGANGVLVLYIYILIG